MANHNYNYKKERALLKKYLEGNCTEEEKAWVEEWYLALDNKMDVLTEMGVKADLDDLYHRLSSIPKQRSLVKIYIGNIAAAAAAVFFICVVSILLQQKQPVEQVTNNYVVPGSPGSNRAILSFDDGEGIQLSDQKEGIINNGTALTYDDGTLIKTIEKAKMATLYTPAGGQYQLVLPDGTKVWLNSVSSIKYPTSFEKAKERMVYIEGEVYLEVAHDAKKPFIVQTNQQRIEVLGTRFVVNTYGENNQVLTTLVEGKVRLKHNSSGNEVELNPGEQAIVSDNAAIAVKKVDAEEIVSWKDGLYIVNDESLAEYARKIERWYDVEVDIGNHGDKRMSAIIPRDVKLSEVLKAIELKTGVEFIIEGRRVSEKR